MKMAVESIEMAPGAIPRPDRVPEQRFLSPETCSGWRRSSESYFAKSFGFRVRDRKIGPWAFVSSNSENISRTTFLKYKNSRKQELTLWHLVNRLVPKNA